MPWQGWSVKGRRRIYSEFRCVVEKKQEESGKYFGYTVVIPLEDNKIKNIFFTDTVEI